MQQQLCTVAFHVDLGLCCFRLLLKARDFSHFGRIALHEKRDTTYSERGRANSPRVLSFKKTVLKTAKRYGRTMSPFPMATAYVLSFFSAGREVHRSASNPMYQETNPVSSTLSRLCFSLTAPARFSVALPCARPVKAHGCGQNSMLNQQKFSI